MAKILIVEDDESILTEVKTWLEFERYSVEIASNGADAIYLLSVFSYDLIVLDWELPGISGIEIMRAYRTKGGQAPVIMVTGKTSLSEKEVGFEAGADDYLCKPFSMRELAMRITACLRRPQSLQTGTLSYGEISMDTAVHTVTVAGQPLKLLPSEFALLEFLLRHPGELFSIDYLLSRVWKADAIATDIAVRTCIARLRRKVRHLCPHYDVIRTVHGVGYGLNTGATAADEDPD